MFHKKLKQLRQMRNMSQKDLAMITAISATEIAQLEANENVIPTFLQVQQLAQSLGTNINYFVDTHHGYKHSRLCSTMLLNICNIPFKGHGVIAMQSIPVGTVIEIAPVRSFPAKDRPIVDQTEIFEYYFVKSSNYRPNKEVEGYLVFGLSTFCNHSEAPNTQIEWHEDELGDWAHLIAIQDITAGEEVTLYYTNVNEYPNVDKFL